MVTLFLAQNQGASFLADPLLGGKIQNLTLINRFGQPVPIIQGHFTYPSLFCQDGCFIMCPWVNRINADHFTYNNSSYTITPVFYDENHLPLHGLYAMSKRTILQQTETSLTIQPTQMDSRFAAFTETFRLIDPSTFEIEVEAFNNSQDQKEQLIGFGFHPYLQLPNTTIDQLQLTTNLDQYIKVDTKLLPLGDQITTGNISDILPQKSVIQNRVLDNGFTKSSVDSSGIFVQIYDLRNNYGIQVKYYSNQYQTPMKYWQIFTPPDRTRIAIEPQTCCTDAFRVKNSGMISLKPGQRIKTGFRIEMI